MVAIIDKPASTMVLEVIRTSRDKELLINASQFKFQFWPIRFSESIRVRYDETIVPGSSHPVYQWIATEGRRFDFTVYFASDVLTKELFSGNTLSINVSDAIKALRYLVFPSYKALIAVFQAQAPPLVKLKMTNSGIGLSNIDEVVGVITDLSYEYMKFFFDGRPRLVECSIGFQEVINRADTFKFADRQLMSKTFEMRESNERRRS